MSRVVYFYKVKKILIAAPISESLRNFLLSKEYELLEYNSSFSENKKEISGIITSNKMMLYADDIKKIPQLQWIARLGSGMEIIDTDYCKQHGIRYFSSPLGIANSVAEHITGMLLSLLHNIHTSCEEVENGSWIREPNRGIELSGKTVGIIGYGHTGKVVAKKLSVFTNQILVYDKYKSNFEETYVKEVTLEQLQNEADILTFHVPLTNDTKHYYNDDFFSKMKKNHILINSSRGGIIETKVILSGLQSGKMIGACLDVLEEEKRINEVLQTPDNIIQQLLSYNVIITPHIAGYSHDAIQKMSDEIQNQLEKIV